MAILCSSAPGAFSKPQAQLFLINFADRRERKRIHALHAVRQLKFGNALLTQEAAHLNRTQGLFHHQVRAAFFTQQAVLHAHQRGMDHRFVAQQQVFDLFGGDLLATTVDLIFLAPLHGDVPLLVDGDQIAGTVKAVGVEGAGIVFRAVEIAAEGVRAARHQTSDLPARQRVAVLVRDPHLIIRAHRAALGVNDAFRRVVERGVVHQPFRHAKHLLQLAADFRRNTRRKRGGETCTAHLEQFEGFKLRVPRAVGNRLQPQADRGRHQWGDVYLMLLNQREAERGARIVRQHHAAACRENA